MITSQQATNPLLRVFRNVDQKVDLLIKTIDRRPVLLDEDARIVFRAFDEFNHTVLEETAQEENYEKGHYALYLSREETGSLFLGNYTWAILLITDAEERLLYTDKDYGANAPMRVMEGPVPPQTPPQQIDVESLHMGFTGALTGAAQMANPLGGHSVVLGMDNYFGSVTVEASLDDDIPMQDSEWTQISQTDYTAEAGNKLIGFVGNYKWVRLFFSDTIGLTSISYRAS